MGSALRRLCITVVAPTSLMRPKPPCLPRSPSLHRTLTLLASQTRPQSGVPTSSRGWQRRVSSLMANEPPLCSNRSRSCPHPIHVPPPHEKVAGEPEVGGLLFAENPY